MKYILVLIFSAYSLMTIAQDDNVLTFDEYISIVKEHHPVTYQAKLLNDMAASTKMMARGGFDPKVEADWNHKSYSGSNYYSVISSAVKVPTWYGIDLKAGYDRTAGDFLDASDALPSRGLWNAGISVPLGRGFILDNRRAELKRADIFQSVTEQEQILMVNKLLFEASNTYLEWQAAKAYLDIALEGLELSSIRFSGTRQSYINGDKPAIDTLESYISLQNRQLELQKAEQIIENATLALNNYLWIEGVTPIELKDDAIPEAMDINLLRVTLDSLVLLQDQWIASHPELLLIDYKLAEIDIDQRLAREEIKPDLRLMYNPLVAVADDALFDQLNPNNFKLGASFSYPILQRKQRGKIQLNKIKILDTEFKRTTKNQEISVKLNTYINNIRQAQRQYQLLNETMANYNNMLIAELRKLSVGESSIFLVNSRENKYLESRYKQVEASRKLLINRFIYLLYSARIGETL